VGVGMWWSSFQAVIVDLWWFAFGRTESTQFGTNTTEQTQPRLGMVADTTSDEAAAVTDLVTNVRYDKQHPTTVSIRHTLADQAILNPKTGDLTLLEWLAYQMRDRTQLVPWLSLALTPPGEWHQTLKGLPSIRIGLEPKTSAIMEWYTTDRIGHLAVVRKVTPDNKLTLGQIGDPLPGVYSEQVVDAREWREWRPVFIELM